MAQPEDQAAPGTLYIAILTGTLNPNVMIETGRMEALQRPLLLLRDAAAAGLPPTWTACSTKSCAPQEAT